MKSKFLLEQGHSLILSKDWFSARQQLSNLSHHSCGRKQWSTFFFFGGEEEGKLIRESEISILSSRPTALFPPEGFTPEEELNMGKHQLLSVCCLTWWWAFTTTRPLPHLCPSHPPPGTSGRAILCARDCFLTLFTAISPYLLPPY